MARYIATVETSKHRFFTFLDAAILPDNMLVNVAIDDAWTLGILSSRVHVAWAMRAGGRLGVGNDPRYNKTRCFEPFPFPPVGWAPPTDSPANGGRCPPYPPISDSESDGRPSALEPRPSNLSSERIRHLAEQIDAHRKRQQSLHPGLTLTGIYNVLERLRQIEAASATGSSPQALTGKERKIHEQGLVSVLAQLQDELDAAVLTAYGWEDLNPALVGKPGGTTPLTDKPTKQAQAEEELLRRLVALNAERAAEEARGLVRWLRPEFQNPGGTTAQQIDTGAPTAQAQEPTTAKHPWPKTLPEQFQAVRDLLAAQPAPASAEQLARRFKRAQTKKVAELLETLEALGQVQCPEPGRYTHL